MSPAKTDHRPAGLRERKKAKTREAIQQHALRLFREQGYEATTMGQIADAAEVSPSTVFRYFATKEELVVSDEQDAFFTRAWRAQPADLPLMQALRRAVHDTMKELSPEELGAQRDRGVLMVTVPELWAANLANVTHTRQTVTHLVAERTGRSPDDAQVRALSGTIFGILLDAMLRWGQEPEQDIAQSLDDILAFLDNDHFNQLAAPPDGS
ncbi:TetR/AcrR family transcriptional regulator [Streptomyces sp. SCSIO ZS0520]|uniref:TetR family regulator n=1 Tax=Streptomyces albus (strain ATCC 21838 / DSM 41398 / FERM P-419 / JCM 4703 / NBRC 107858) TaxID=1081613 RepID=A0A0B5FA01_STRA4|nr:TetR family transcriptional regulator [Streptomyces sp. SCSIO ZS0520]AJE87686.1 TetR family regulator [Streptomyces albus]